MSLITKEFPVTLHEYIEKEIIPNYATFDKAHRTDHAKKVIEDSLQLAQYYEVNRMMVYTIAAYHDLGLCEGREFHHLASGKIMMADTQLRKWFSEEQLQTMKEAVEDHRASNKYAPRSIYGKIVAEADRIINPEVTLRRTVQYGLSHYPEMDQKEQYLRFLKHLNEKYAEGGYLKLWIPQSANARKLEELRLLIKNKDALQQIFDKLYLEETVSALHSQHSITQ